MDSQDMKTDMYAGVDPEFFWSGLSPSHAWSEKTNDALYKSVVLDQNPTML